MKSGMGVRAREHLSSKEYVAMACLGWERGGGVELCEFFEGYAANGSDAIMPNGIYSLDDLKQFGREKG